MSRVPALILSTFVSAAIPIIAAETASIEGRTERIPISYENQTVLLEAAQTARAFGWTAKADGKLLALCRAQICVPVRLDQVQHKNTPDGLFVEGAALGKALDFTVETNAGSVRLRTRPGAAATAPPPVPAYHEKWGRSRGFRKGNTLPDIPLYDLDGREVRFSSFLGKKYIIYCWASW